MNELREHANNMIASSQENARRLYNMIGASWPINEAPDDIAKEAAALMASVCETEARISVLVERVRQRLTPSRESPVDDVLVRSSHRPESR